MAANLEPAELVAHPPTDADAEEIRAVVRDYYEGWFDADPTRMDRALHRELAKRSLWSDAAGGEVLRTTTAERMVELTASGEGVEAGSDRRVEIRIDDVHGAIALWPPAPPSTSIISTWRARPRAGRSSTRSDLTSATQSGRMP